MPDHHLTVVHTASLEVGAIVITYFRMRKLRHPPPRDYVTEVTQLVHGGTGVSKDRTFALAI